MEMYRMYESECQQ